MNTTAAQLPALGATVEFIANTFTGATGTGVVVDGIDKNGDVWLILNTPAGEQIAVDLYLVVRVIA